MKTTVKESIVKKMREIREQLNEKIADKDFQEQKEYIRQTLEELKKKRSN